MTLAADIRSVRNWTGRQPSDTDIQQAITDTGTLDLAALSILKQRRADMVSQPGKLAVAGDVTVETTPAQLAALDAQIGALEKLTGTGPARVTVSTLTRRSERNSVGCWPAW